MFKFSYTQKCFVPPSPEVISEAKRLFKNAKNQDPNINPSEFLRSIGLGAGNPLGKDKPTKIDTDFVEGNKVNVQNIPVPSFKPSGDVNVLCILCQFNDNKGKESPKHYSDLLFSKKTYPTGSVNDYYNVVSKGKINIVGEVFGWITLPEPYSYYVGNQNGGDESGYPHNAKKMIEDTVTVLLKDNSIDWDKYDINKDGIIDTLCVVHAGKGARVYLIQKKEKKQFGLINGKLKSKLK